MELIKKYIDRLEHVHGGIYHIQCDGSTTDEEISMIHEWWRMFYQDKSPKSILVVTRDNVEISYRTQFDFYTAMKLVREGKRVTRDYSDESFYIYMDPVTRIVMEQIVDPDVDYKPTRYAMDEEDIDGLWKLVPSDE